MALVAWYPLINNLINNGVGTVTTSGTPTFSTGGKIGNCMTGNDITFSIPSIANSKVWSICFWGYVVSSQITGNWTLLARVRDNGSNFRIEACPSSCGNGIYCYSTANNGSYAICTGGMTAPIGGFYDQWCHVCVTSDGTTISGYYNGQLRSTWAYNGTGAITGIFDLTNNAKCKKNDLRIYDHCLSAKEVETIARGLVLHYPLSLSMPNLAKGSNTDSTSTNTFIFSEATGGSTRSIEYDGGIPCAKITRNSTAHSGWPFLHYDNWDRAAIKPSTTYTLSFDIIGSGSGSIGFNGFMQGNATNNISASVSSVQNTFNSDRWSHLVFRTTTIDDFTGKGTSQTIYMGCSYLNNTDVWIMMKNMKLEEGVHDTPWIPHTSDTGYSTMGYNDNIEYDVSGYNNHSIKNNTVSYDSDTARYVTSTYLGSNGYLQAVNRCPVSLPSDSLTVNIWVKPITWGTPISCTEGGGWNFEETGSGLQFQFYVSGVGYKPAKCSVTGASLQDGKWHMLTGTYDRLSKQVKFYIDGILKVTTDSGSTNGAGYANNFLILGGEAGGSGPASTAYIGNLSDARIYATALSATQVAELYNTALSLSSNGTLLGYEFVEA